MKLKRSAKWVFYRTGQCRGFAEIIAKCGRGQLDRVLRNVEKTWYFVTKVEQYVQFDSSLRAAGAAQDID